MMLTNEDLLAISSLLDKKLEPINERTKRIEFTIEAIQEDINIIKKVITEHSEKLRKIS